MNSLALRGPCSLAEAYADCDRSEVAPSCGGIAARLLGGRGRTGATRPILPATALLERTAPRRELRLRCKRPEAAESDLEAMEKLVYVLWKRPGLSDDEFNERLLGPTAQRFVALGVQRLAANVADADARAVQKARLTQLDVPIAGTLSFWLDMADDRAPYEEALAGLTARTAGYLVCESVPIVNTTRSAPLGERTPGINVVALIERPERLTHAQWVAHWFGHHRRVALETQCTYAYVRNEVVRPLTDGAPPWAAVVEEGFPAEAVTDPMLWYCADGDPEKMKANMARMIESCQAFLDLDRVESHPLSEYRITD